MKKVEIFPLIMLVLLPIDAFAYLDPVTGSIIIQSAIASIAAGFYIIKLYWYKILGFFSRKKSTDKDVILDEE